MPRKLDIEEITLRCKVSHRGGGIEIDLSRKGFKGQKMTAYQNYLGGGMLGSIQNDCTVKGWRDSPKLCKLAEELARHFHNLTNHDEDEWESATFEEGQNRASRAY
jgi:hypothetical protein